MSANYDALTEFLLNCKHVSIWLDLIAMAKKAPRELLTKEALVANDIQHSKLKVGMEYVYNNLMDKFNNTQTHKLAVLRVCDFVNYLPISCRYQKLKTPYDPDYSCKLSRISMYSVIYDTSNNSRVYITTYELDGTCNFCDQLMDMRERCDDLGSMLNYLIKHNAPNNVKKEMNELRRFYYKQHILNVYSKLKFHRTYWEANEYLKYESFIMT